MRITSVINYKGGVGKTSVTANLAAELAWRGYKVLLLDMDPQASLTFSFVQPEVWKKVYEQTRTIKVWFDSMSEDRPVELAKLIFTPQKVNGVVRHSGKGGQLDLIASHLGLINVDLELATELGGASLQQAKTKYLKVHRRLAEGLKSINADKYDVVLLDCPPNFNIVTKNAIVASDTILVPAKPDYLSTLGIDYLRLSVKKLVAEYNDFIAINHTGQLSAISPAILGVVFTMIDVRSGEPIRALRPYIRNTVDLGLPVFDTNLRENKTIYADAPQYGIPVVLVGGSNPTQKTVIDELKAFASEFVAKISLRAL